jgi:hypothetical protein
MIPIRSFGSNVSGANLSSLLTDTLVVSSVRSQKYVLAIWMKTESDNWDSSCREFQNSSIKVRRCCYQWLNLLTFCYQKKRLNHPIVGKAVFAGNGTLSSNRITQFTQDISEVQILNWLFAGRRFELNIMLMLWVHDKRVNHSQHSPMSDSVCHNSEVDRR